MTTVPNRYVECRLVPPPVGEHEQGTGLRCLLQALRNQCVQAVEALAQVARVQRHEHLQASRKTQLEASPRSSATTSGTWAGLVNRTRTPAGSSISTGAKVSGGGTAASTNRTA
jgi:hypothetical protein